jgi:hypothetical protein
VSDSVERVEKLEAACRNQIAWIERHLQNLEYRVTEQPYCGHGGNGFSGAMIPDWDLRQKLESLREDLAE